MPPNPNNRLFDLEVFALAILAVPAILIALFLVLAMAKKFKLGWHEVPDRPTSALHGMAKV
jgi:hypothetical protein